MFMRVIVFSGLLAASALAAEPTWPRWRGPNGDGQSPETDLPIQWNEKSIAWRAPLRGAGQSSPIIWGDHVFLTTAPDAGKSRVVLALDRKSGKLLWEKEVWKGNPEKSHAQNGWATATCATDGERVVAFFGKGGLHCFTVDGKPLWSKELGVFPGEWGTAASPVIVGDLVIQNCDSAGEGLLLAFDKTTGAEKWRTPRTAPERGGWTTPVMVKVGDKYELVLNGEKAVTGYDLATGKELWHCKSFIGRGEPTVTPGAEGLLFVVSGQPGDIFAIRPGGRGDVTKTHMAWYTPPEERPGPAITNPGGELHGGHEHGGAGHMLRRPDREGTMVGAAERGVLVISGGGRKPGVLPERGGQHDGDGTRPRAEGCGGEHARCEGRGVPGIADPVRRAVVHPFRQGRILHRCEVTELLDTWIEESRHQRPRRPQPIGPIDTHTLSSPTSYTSDTCKRIPKSRSTYRSDSWAPTSCTCGFFRMNCHNSSHL